MLEDFSGGKVNYSKISRLTTKVLDLQKLKTERHAEAVLKLETDQAAALAVKEKRKQMHKR